MSKRIVSIGESSPTGKYMHDRCYNKHACFFSENALSFINLWHIWGSLVRTSKFNGWRSMHIPLPFGLPIPNLPLFHLAAGWKSLSLVHMIENGKTNISVGTRPFSVGGGRVLCKGALQRRGKVWKTVKLALRSV